MANREIKFQVWDEKAGCMIEWGCLRQTAFNGEDCQVLYRAMTGQLGPLRQFTGLRDKNGVEIYEGDIFGNVPALRCVVERKEDGAYVLRFRDRRIPDISILDSKVLRSTVQGNIYENPELLESNIE